MTEVLDRKIATVLDLIEARFGTGFRRALIVGCGAAAEVFALAARFDCDVVGIDISDALFPQIDDPRVVLTVADAAEMPFPDEHFDLIYSFHALEHIERLEDALAEMRRVLKPGGSVFVGTPNKSRLVGYIGSDTTMANKLRWNLADWTMRLTGRWENALGAHAGFTRAELSEFIASTFGHSRDQTLDYYLRLYRRRARLVRALAATGLGALAFPAVYVSN
jgi:ubiquinone/menaquinone biosynthesis C-methylase UbiE